MFVYHELKAEVKQFMLDNHINYVCFCYICGIERTAFSRWITNQRYCPLQMQKKIVKTLEDCKNDPSIIDRFIIERFKLKCTPKADRVPKN